MEEYVLSVWENHENPEEWRFDICPMDDYFKNALVFMVREKKPYYYSPITHGCWEYCSSLADEIRAHPEMIKKLENQLSH